MNKEEIKHDYGVVEAKADSLLVQLGSSPWTAAILVVSHLGAFLLGAWLF